MTDGDSEWPLQAADAAFGNAGWTRRVERIYDKALERNDVDPMVATLWSQRWVARPRLRPFPKKLGTLLARGEVGRRAAVVYFKSLGRLRASRRISACVRRHRQALRADAECWGIVGYALLSIEKRRCAVTWMSDWPERADAQPWMLLNLVYVLRGSAAMARPTR